MPLGNVNAKTLAEVIEYCKFHVDNPAADDDARKEAIKKLCLSGPGTLSPAQQHIVTRTRRRRSTGRSRRRP